MKLRWTTPALSNLESIGDYIAAENPAAAKRVLIAIRDQARMLIEQPYIGRPGRVPGTRELVISDTPYIVPYRVRDDSVEILSVLHASRQWPAEFK